MSLTADAFIVLVLVIGQHKGWLPPFIGSASCWSG